MEPPTPRPELFFPISMGSAPPMIRFWVQYRRWEPASSLTQSSSGCQKGPASRTTMRQPRRATGSGAHHGQVDLLVVAVTAHGRLARELAVVDVEEEAGVVRPGPDRALEEGRPHGSSRGAIRAGSSWVAPARS